MGCTISETDTSKHFETECIGLGNSGKRYPMERFNPQNVRKNAEITPFGSNDSSFFAKMKDIPLPSRQTQCSLFKH
jgi:hypothetical protein